MTVLGMLHPARGATLILNVSPTGSDSGTGSVASPFRTIERACTEYASMRDTLAQGANIVLEGGTYTLNEPVRISTSCSGTADNPLVIRSAPESPAILSGGAAISGWQMYDSDHNIFVASVIGFDFRQLYVNGEKRVRARTPNATGCANAPRFLSISSFDDVAKTITIPQPLIGVETSPENPVEMHLMTIWSDNVLRIDRIVNGDSSAVLSVSSPERGILFSRQNPSIRPGQMYYLENSLSFLDSPGEWFLDRQAGYLYYKAFANEDPETENVIAPRLDTLFKIEGDDGSSPVRHIVVENLQFSYSTDLRPSRSGSLTLQAGQYNVDVSYPNQTFVGRPISAFYLANAEGIRIHRNIFSNLAATGVDFHSGAKDCAIIGNVFQDIGGNAITLAKFTQDSLTSSDLLYNPSDTTEWCSKDTISNNFISNVTTEVQGACAIASGYPRYVDIEHNEISNTSYSGISIGFGWTASTNPMRGNNVSLNDIHHVMTSLTDGGGIYTLSNQEPGSQMSFNFLHDITKAPWAEFPALSIYLDEGTSGYSVVGNAMVNAWATTYHNAAGTNSESENGPMNPTVAAHAGITPEYREILARLRLPDPSTRSFIKSESCLNTLFNVTIAPASTFDTGSFAARSFQNDNQSSLDFKLFNSKGEDTFEISPRYSSSKSFSMAFALNYGTEQVIVFPANSSSPESSPVHIGVRLRNGLNTLRLSSPAQDFPQINGLEIRIDPTGTAQRIPRTRLSYSPSTRSVILGANYSGASVRLLDAQGHGWILPVYTRAAGTRIAAIPSGLRGLFFISSGDGEKPATPLFVP